MRKGYLFGRRGSFLCTLILFAIACNSNSSAPPSADTLAATADTTAKTNPAHLAHMSGYLNILYIDTSTFFRLQDSARRKITFRFLLKEPDSLTLSGWSNDSSGQRFPGQPPRPNITLWVGGASAYETGSGIYLGNLVLYNWSIRQILKDIRTNKSTFILFVPQDPAANNGQVTYQIRTTRTDPHTLNWSDLEKSLAPFANPVETNPSPPRGAFN